MPCWVLVPGRTSPAAGRRDRSAQRLAGAETRRRSPSGLDCDTGHAAVHTIRALHTCTFIAPKIGFQAPGAGQYTGQVHVLDIGAPRRLIEHVLNMG